MPYCVVLWNSIAKSVHGLKRRETLRTLRGKDNRIIGSGRVGQTEDLCESFGGFPKVGCECAYDDIQSQS